MCVGAGRDDGESRVGTLGVLGSWAGMALEWGGDRKVWAQVLVMERLVREGLGVGLCLLSPPSSPERGALEKA